MKNISQEELKEILKKHEMWLKDEEGGKRANLSYVNLSNADLSHANLRAANLSYVNLSNADLSHANLRVANLMGINLSNSNLHNADLTCANLRVANLTDADLTNVDLTYANLEGTNLTDADLRNANLKYTNLRCTDLTSANLENVDLWNANLINSKLVGIKTNINTMGYNLACPEKGSFIGYKKAGGCIVKLLILDDAKRSSATTSKCRCDKAKVLEIKDINTGELMNEITSTYDHNFVYKVGEIVSVDDFDENRWNECSAGIHFFVNKENALNY